MKLHSVAEHAVVPCLDSARITFGNGYHDPNSTVVLYKNDVVMASAAAGVLSLTHHFEFRNGDVIKRALRWERAAKDSTRRETIRARQSS